MAAYHVFVDELWCNSLTFSINFVHVIETNQTGHIFLLTVEFVHCVLSQVLLWHFQGPLPPFALCYVAFVSSFLL